MTGQRETTRYAVPVLTRDDRRWTVWADALLVGWIYPSGAVGFTAVTNDQRYAGLWPTKQAAGEQLVKQAGYELEAT